MSSFFPQSNLPLFSYENFFSKLVHFYIFCFCNIIIFFWIKRLKKNYNPTFILCLNSKLVIFLIRLLLGINKIFMFETVN